MSLILLNVTLAACGVPSDGPSNQAVLNSSEVELIDVTRDVATSLREEPGQGFPAEFIRQPLPAIDRIGEGDELQLQIFENIDNGLFSSVRGAPTTITPLMVDSTGHVSIPYVGRIRAVGNTLEQLRMIIERKLSQQTPDPQIIVSRADKAGLSVTVSGDVQQPGTYPLEVASRSIGAVIAQSGGASAPPTQVQVTLRRNRTVGSASLQAIQSDPRQDVAILPGDKVIVTIGHHRVFVLGATGTQRVVPLDKPRLTLIDALATSGGLNAEAANPDAVYVLRTRAGERPTVYRFDYSEPEGLIASSAFVLRDADVVYVAESATTKFGRILRAMLGAATPVNQIADLANSG